MNSIRAAISSFLAFLLIFSSFPPRIRKTMHVISLHTYLNWADDQAHKSVKQKKKKKKKKKK